MGRVSLRGSSKKSCWWLGTLTSDRPFIIYFNTIYKITSQLVLACGDDPSLQLRLTFISFFANHITSINVSTTCDHISHIINNNVCFLPFFSPSLKAMCLIWNVRKFHQWKPCVVQIDCSFKIKFWEVHSKMVQRRKFICVCEWVFFLFSLNEWTHRTTSFSWFYSFPIVDSHAITIRILYNLMSCFSLFFIFLFARTLN